MAAKSARQIAEDAADRLGLTGFDRVMADGRRLRYRAVGQGVGTPILLLHGFASDALAWALVQEPLAERAGRPVIALELPGHGGSDPDVRDGRMESQVAATVAAVDALGVDRLHLVGHSNGAAVAVLAADLLGDRAASLAVLCAAGFGFDDDRGFMPRFLAADTPEALRAVLSGLYVDPDRILTDTVLAMVLAHKSDPGIAAALASIVADIRQGAYLRTGVRRKAARFDGPAKLIWGAADRLTPVHHAWGLPGHMGVHVLPEVRHAPQIDCPDLVTRLLAELAATG